MNKYLSLTKRNCLVFLRDRGAVFFSLLTMLIVLMLQGIFLGHMNEQSIIDLLKEYGGMRDTAVDAENAKHLVQYWTLAGILTVNAVTVALTVMSNMINDFCEGKLASLYSAPVSRRVIAFSYITAAVAGSILLCTLTLIIALVYIVGSGAEMLALAALGKIMLLTLLNCLVASVVMYLLAMFVKSSGAWSGIGTVVGTLIGFIGAIYIPLGALPESVATALKYIPVLHGTALMRQACCEAALEQTFTNVPDQLLTEYNDMMGIRIKMGDEFVSEPFQLLFLAGCGIIAFIVIAIVQKRRNISDR